MIHYHVFTFNPFQENTYLLWNDQKTAWIIDPGCINQEEQEELNSFIIKEGLSVEKVLLTHSHIDHVLGLSFCQKNWKIDAWNHPLDASTFDAIPQYAPTYGMPYKEGNKPLNKLEHNQNIFLGEENFEVRFVPGHAPGHVVFIHHEQKLILGGDVLFRGSVGRTDLPGGDSDILKKSIRSEIYSLKDNYTIFPGHGPETNVFFEKENNPFVKA
ncbi:MAG: hydroxyacylglutathione hydrolase [Luteibaculaceae bacterium]|jgi:hydroxyacylglutathione hydrolase